MNNAYIELDSSMSQIAKRTKDTAPQHKLNQMHGSSSMYGWCATRRRDPLPGDDEERLALHEVSVSATVTAGRVCDLRC